jgi:hypothetical protein
LILALDPGTTESALVLLEEGIDAGVAIAEHHIMDNAAILSYLSRYVAFHADVLVIEQIEAMGQMVGKETFETVFWSGRFAQGWGRRFERLTRRQIKLHVCGTSQAKDGHIRAAIVDRFGGTALAIGKKNAPGLLYGIASHKWAALAVGLTWMDKANGEHWPL